MFGIETKAVALIEKELSPIAAKAEKVTITNPKEMKAATVMLSTLNGYAKTLKARKEEITKPLNAGLKSARELFKSPENKLEVAIDAIRAAMSTYQLEAERKAKEEEDAIAARVGEGKGKLKPETAVRKMDEIDRPDTTVSTEEGTVRFRTDQKLKTLDYAKVVAWCAKYAPYHLKFDEAAILKLLKDGKDVDGAEIEIVKTPVNLR